MPEISSHEAITIFHKLTIKNGCHLPLLKVAENMKQTVSHELHMTLIKYVSNSFCRAVLDVKVQAVRHSVPRNSCSYKD